MNHVCPRCMGELRCLGGRSAHYSNWYCKDEKGCGWQAWDDDDKKRNEEKKTPMVQVPLNKMLQLLAIAHHAYHVADDAVDEVPDELSASVARKDLKQLNAALTAFADGEEDADIHPQLQALQDAIIENAKSTGRGQWLNVAGDTWEFHVDDVPTGIFWLKVLEGKAP